MTDETSNTDQPLDKMTVKELREIAKEIPGTSGYSSMKKDELIALISESQGAKPEESAAAEETAEVKEEVKEAAQEEKTEKKPAAEKKAKPAKPAAKKTAKKLVTVKDYKEAINALQDEKQSVQQSANKKEISILRRRINRLKKRSRKAKTAAA